MVKYESMTNISRNTKLYEYWFTHPHNSLREIGIEFGGISKQAVSGILKRERKLYRIDKHLCPACGCSLELYLEQLHEEHDSTKCAEDKIA